MLGSSLGRFEMGIVLGLASLDLSAVLFRFKDRNFTGFGGTRWIQRRSPVIQLAKCHYAHDFDRK